VEKHNNSNLKFQLVSEHAWSRTVKVWTNFSQQDKTWPEFSTLEVAICMQRIYGVFK
jgi:hypothetical protein